MAVEVAGGNAGVVAREECAAAAVEAAALFAAAVHARRSATHLRSHGQLDALEVVSRVVAAAAQVARAVRAGRIGPASETFPRLAEGLAVEQAVVPVAEQPISQAEADRAAGASIFPAVAGPLAVVAQAEVSLAADRGPAEVAGHRQVSLTVFSISVVVAVPIEAAGPLRGQAAVWVAEPRRIFCATIPVASVLERAPVLVMWREPGRGRVVMAYAPAAHGQVAMAAEFVLVVRGRAAAEFALVVPEKVAVEFALVALVKMAAGLVPIDLAAAIDLAAVAKELALGALEKMIGQVDPARVEIVPAGRAATIARATAQAVRVGQGRAGVVSKGGPAIGLTDLIDPTGQVAAIGRTIARGTSTIGTDGTVGEEIPTST